MEKVLIFGKTKTFIKLTKTNLLLQIILNSYKTARNIKIINTGNTGLPKINNVTKIRNKIPTKKLSLPLLSFLYLPILSSYTTFFFLIFSAIEFGVGLVLLLLQHILLRTLNLNDSETNIFKFVSRFNREINTNRINWKL